MSWLDEVLQVGVYLLKCHVSLSLALHKDWEKREGKQGDKRSNSSFIYGTTEADFMAVGGGCFLGSEKISHSHFQLLARVFVLGE